MAKIDFSRVLQDFDGKDLPYIKPDGKTDGDLTLRKVAIEALLATLGGPDDRAEQLSGQDKLKHAELARRIHRSSAPLTLKAEDVALLKDRIGRAWQPVAVLGAFEMLEGKGG